MKSLVLYVDANVSMLKQIHGTAALKLTKNFLFSVLKIRRTSNHPPWPFTLQVQIRIQFPRCGCGPAGPVQWQLQLDNHQLRMKEGIATNKWTCGLVPQGHAGPAVPKWPLCECVCKMCICEVDMRPLCSFYLFSMLLLYNNYVVPAYIVPKKLLRYKSSIVCMFSAKFSLWSYFVLVLFWNMIFFMSPVIPLQFLDIVRT